MVKFDERLDLPIYDLMESLDQQSRAATQYASGRISLAVLDELNHDNDRLLEQREALAKRFGSVAHVWKTRQLLLALSALLVYVIALLIYGSTIDNGSRLTQIATRAFVDTWPFTSVVVPLIVGLLAVPWARILIRSSGPSTSGNDANEP
jgi:hypothetical protein